MSETWNLPAEDVVAMPLPELALRVLEHYRITGEWNWRNWMLTRQQHDYPRRPQTMQALSEAWAWIVNHGLVVRNFGQDSAEAVVLSRQGAEVLARGLPWLRATQRLDVEMVGVLEAKARPLFVRGDFEGAAFMAMKEVEVAVRERSGLPTTLVGTKLMQEAFKPGGPLHQSDGDPGEGVALMDLFKGAIGSFKNPSSHRRVDIDDPTEAAEVVLVADLLLRLLGKIEM